MYTYFEKYQFKMLTATGLEPKTTYFVNEHSTIWPTIQATIECGFTLKRIRDMTKTYSHINQCFSVCHLDLKSVTSHNFSRIQSLTACRNSTLFASLNFT